jgi:hypothetical protein
MPSQPDIPVAESLVRDADVATAGAQLHNLLGYCIIMQEMAAARIALAGQ